VDRQGKELEISSRNPEITQVNILAIIFLFQKSCYEFMFHTATDEPSYNNACRELGRFPQPSLFSYQFEIPIHAGDKTY